MALWASSADTSSKLNLLMVCVEVGQSGLRTAQDFGQRFKLPGFMTNGYIEQKRELPSFGQLGCQGFVVIGPHGEFAMQRTVPCYLEKGEMAFAAVEKLLSSLWSISLAPAPAAHAAPIARSVHSLTTSVGVVEMDAEHEELNRMVEELRKGRKPETLSRLLALWREHSEHEENLFEKFDFGRHRTAEDGNAATRPHCEHHRLIASMMEERPSEGQIDKIIAEIQRHAEIYDAAYAGKLGEAASAQL